MSVSEEECAARFVLSQCMIEILRPGSDYDVAVTPNQRIIGYAIAIGVYSGAPLGVTKLHEMTGLPKSTVRGVIASITALGWIVRRPDKTFVFTDEFHEKAAEWFGLARKYQAILSAAEALRHLGYAQPST